MDFQIAISGQRFLTRQIYTQIRAAVLEGRVRSGERLPSTRELADQLTVSRKTVVVAYDMLVNEGLIIARRGSGAFVENLGVIARKRVTAGRAIVLAPSWNELPPLPAVPRTSVRFDFGIGVPDLKRFPWTVWGRTVRSCSRPRPQSSPSYGHPAGYSPLREVIAAHIGFRRGVRCNAADVVVTNGAQQAFQLIARLLVQPGTVVAMEHPGYSMARGVFLTHGASIVDVPVDGEGLMVKQLPTNAKLVFTTPSHQFPTGVAMSYSRRLALLEWARARGAAIIEDDYDSEFRFDGRPLESLQGMDPAGVIYVGTFSKSLFPALRLGFVVAPPALTAALIAAKQLADWHSPNLPQAATAAFMTEGHFARHIRKMRNLYADRRDRLLTELQRSVSDWLGIIPSSTGLHVAARLEHPMSAEAVVASAFGAGIRIHPLPKGIALGVGAIEASEVKAGIERLRKVFRTLSSRQVRGR